MLYMVSWVQLLYYCLRSWVWTCADLTVNRQRWSCSATTTTTTTTGKTQSFVSTGCKWLIEISCEIGTDRVCVSWQDSGATFLGSAWARSQLSSIQTGLLGFKSNIFLFCSCWVHSFQIIDRSDSVSGCTFPGVNFWTCKDLANG